jgi:Zn-dependent protease with chaperone function
MSLFIIVVFSILGYSKYTNSPIYIDREFRQFFNDFKNDAERHKTPLDLYQLTITFVPTLPGTVAAQCFIRTNTVEVSEELWQVLSTSQKKALIYHELGHCVLLRDHVEGGILFPSNSNAYLCPLSLMYPTVDPMDVCFDEFKDFYTEELFTNPYNQKVFPRRN